MNANTRPLIFSSLLRNWKKPQTAIEKNQRHAEKNGHFNIDAGSPSPEEISVGGQQDHGGQKCSRRIAKYLSAKEIGRQNAQKSGKGFRNPGGKRIDTDQFIQAGGCPEVKRWFVRVNPAVQPQDDPVVEFQNFAGYFSEPHRVLVLERAPAQIEEKGKECKAHEKQQIPWVGWP